MLLPEARKCPQCSEKLLSTWNPVPIQVFINCISVLVLVKLPRGNICNILLVLFLWKYGELDDRYIYQDIGIEIKIGIFIYHLLIKREVTRNWLMQL